ncbi:hypothetical protein [Bradyrhizobium sp. CCBAU 21362]|nr:hypothetical protein [Bradyrhizobium sp. CCBAU 21362]
MAFTPASAQKRVVATQTDAKTPPKTANGGSDDHHHTKQLDCIL